MTDDKCRARPNRLAQPIHHPAAENKTPPGRQRNAFSAAWEWEGKGEGDNVTQRNLADQLAAVFVRRKLLAFEFCTVQLARGCGVKSQTTLFEAGMGKYTSWESLPLVLRGMRQGAPCG